MGSRGNVGIHSLGLLVGLLSVVPACAGEELTRDTAREILDAHLASQGDLTRDIPVGQGLHIAIEKPMDAGAPIRLDMLRVYQELEGQGLITMTDGGGLQGFGGKVRTYDVHLTPEGEKVLGPVHQGKPEYGRGFSIYPIPQSYVRILTCRRTVREVTGIRIVTPDVAVDVEYVWHCAESSPIGELVEKAKKDYPQDPGPPPREGTSSVRLALYDDGWRVALAK